MKEPMAEVVNPTSRIIGPCVDCGKPVEVVQYPYKWGTVSATTVNYGSEERPLHHDCYCRRLVQASEDTHRDEQRTDRAWYTQDLQQEVDALRARVESLETQLTKWHALLEVAR